MNGKKILVRLIWLFLCINIVLFILNLSVKHNEYRVTSEQIDNVVSVLKQQGITVNAQLPERYLPKRIGELNFSGSNARYTVEKNFFGKVMANVKHSVGPSKVQENSESKTQYCSYDDEVLAFDNDYIFYENKKINGAEKLVTEEMAKEYCDRLIKRLYPDDEHKYEIQIEEKEGYLKLYFYPLFEGVPVLDAQIIFDVYEKGVRYAKFYAGTISPISTEKKEIYPVNLVLFGIKEYTKDIESPVITEAKLVYKKLLNNDETWGQEIVPMYKISITGLEDALFVNAYTNEIVK